MLAGKKYRCIYAITKNMTAFARKKIIFVVFFTCRLLYSRICVPCVAHYPNERTKLPNSTYSETSNENYFQQ